MAEYHQIRVNDVVNLMNAYLDSIYTDEVAFVSGTGQQVDDGHHSQHSWITHLSI